jgi:sulfatase maturation enzyme AslB (radical SAM superfamily)
MSLKQYHILDRTIFVDNETGMFSYKTEYVVERGVPFNTSYDFNLHFPRFASLCINLSEACNLKCRYCFSAKNQFSGLRF